ncbi:MAG: SdpI family protein [Patescibacteria group bacterium]|nr:SdpI family protein [Patescibacteria group bacterium]
MSSRAALILSILIILFSLGVGLYFYPSLPSELASHWNIHGEVNGHLSKAWGVVLLPLIMVLLLALLYFLPAIDPLKANWPMFRRSYNLFVVALMIFFAYVYLLSIFWNLGYTFYHQELLLPAIAFLWFTLGSILPHLKRNWFVGIRTPWTISDDRVWEETHHLGGHLFKLSALVTFIGAFFSGGLIPFIVVPLLLSVFILLVYSYWDYQRLHKV